MTGFFIFECVTEVERVIAIAECELYRLSHLMNLVGQRFEQIPEPVIGSHRFNADAEWLSQGLDESDDGTGTMVGNRNFFNRIGIGVGNGVGGRSGMQINT